MLFSTKFRKAPRIKQKIEIRMIWHSVYGFSTSVYSWEYQMRISPRSSD